MTVTFGNALKDFFTRYATFSGRSTRAQYWYVVLALVIFNLITSFPLMVIALATSGLGFILYGLVMIVWLILIVPILALSVRRLHDIDRSGWWLLLFFLVPAISSALITLSFLTPHDPNIFLMALGFLLCPVAAIWGFVWMCTAGTEGPNEYGPDIRELPDPVKAFPPYGMPQQWQQPYGQIPYQGNPYGQNPYQGNSYGQNPYQGNPYGQNPYSQKQNPYNNQ